ncbi:MAG: Lrp/AsnC ligand binding domain-containing protein [Alloprevotella sp.]|nr:Lrp/AsnC ligand binding domain-containing protein [Alloprevotella sp.]
MEKIDPLDLKILSIISRNARIPFKDVATLCNVSRAAIHQHVLKMIDDGIIVGSGYHINPRAIGYGTCSFIGIILERGSLYKEVSKKLALLPEVVECHLLTGDFTLLVKLQCHDNERLTSILNDEIQAIDGVLSTKTLLSLEQTISRDIAIPVNEEAANKPLRRGRKRVVK